MAVARHRAGSSRRLAGLAGVMGAHALLIYALANGLGQRAVDLLRTPPSTEVVAEIKPPAPPKVEPPPPPPPKVVKPPSPPPVAPPRIRHAAPPPPAAIAPAVAAPAAPVAAPVAPPVPSSDPDPAPAVISTPPSLDRGHPCKAPQYPAAARRAEEAGAVTLKFLIDTDGSVVESVVASSSGFERLDEAARRALALCRFSPGSVGGRPERSWARIRYVWKLQ